MSPDALEVSIQHTMKQLDKLDEKLDKHAEEEATTFARVMDSLDDLNKRLATMEQRDSDKKERKEGNGNTVLWVTAIILTLREVWDWIQTLL